MALSSRENTTASTTADICLLVENGNKNTETKFKAWSNFFYQPFVYPKANFWPLTRRQPHSPNVNHNTTSSTTRRSPRAPKPDRAHQWDSSWKPSDSECYVLSHCVTLPESVLETIDHRLATIIHKIFETKSSFHVK